MSERGAKREERTVELIAHEAAKFIREAAGPESLITVTRAYAKKDGRVIVCVSIFPEERERAALAFLARAREDFSDHLKAHTRLAPLPRIDFEADAGEKNRRHLAELGGG